MEMKFFYVILSVVSLVLSADFDIPEANVMDEVFFEYNPEARPASVRKSVVKVSHQLTLTRIISLRDDLLVIDTWQTLSWRDPRLSWDRSYYDDVESINIHPSKIWKPDIVNFHNAGGNSGLIYDDLPVTVTYNGDVIYVPPTRLTTQCQPYGDVYHCIWTFGSWTHDIKKMDINNTYGAIDMSEYEQNSRIAIIASSVSRTLKRYALVPNRYAILTYNLTIRWRDPDQFEGLEPLQMPSNDLKTSVLQNDEHIPTEETVSETILVNATDVSDTEKGESTDEDTKYTQTEEEEEEDEDIPLDEEDNSDLENTDYEDTTEPSQEEQSTVSPLDGDGGELRQVTENTESSQTEDATTGATSKEDTTENSENTTESPKIEVATNSTQNQKGDILKTTQNKNTTETTQNDDAFVEKKTSDAVTDQTSDEKESNEEDGLEDQTESPSGSDEGSSIGAWQRIKNAIWSKD